MVTSVHTHHSVTQTSVLRETCPGSYSEILPLPLRNAFSGIDQSEDVQMKDSRPGPMKEPRNNGRFVLDTTMERQGWAILRSFSTSLCLQVESSFSRNWLMSRRRSKNTRPSLSPRGQGSDVCQVYSMDKASIVSTSIFLIFSPDKLLFSPWNNKTRAKLAHMFIILFLKHM